MAALGMLLVPALLSAQAARPVPRVGILTVAGSPSVDAFLAGLQALGWQDGRNVVIERRYSGTLDRLGQAAAELARARVDVIFAPATANVEAARQAAPLVPVVFAGVADPVGSGFAKSLARPGGHITGFTAVNLELFPKRLQLLQEAVPALARAGFLFDPRDGISRRIFEATEAAGRSIGVGVLPVEVKDLAELEAAFATIVRERMGAVVTGGVTFRLRGRIGELAARHRLPLMGDSRLWVEAGALAAYGASYEDLARRAAGHVDRILRGARPADLPIEQPTRFELILNLRVARALGLTMPPALLVRADQAIE